jgi:hypothetical protein
MLRMFSLSKENGDGREPKRRQSSLANSIGTARDPDARTFEKRTAAATSTARGIRRRTSQGGLRDWQVVRVLDEERRHG